MVGAVLYIVLIIAKLCLTKGSGSPMGRIVLGIERVDLLLSDILNIGKYHCDLAHLAHFELLGFQACRKIQ